MSIATLMGSLNLGGNFGSIFGSQKKGFQKNLTISDLLTTTAAISNDKFYKVGEYTVPPQQQINLGFGDASQPMNQGYLYIKVCNGATTEINGLVRLAVANANETAIDFQNELVEAQLNGDTTDKSKMKAYPEIKSYAVLKRTPSQDDRIQLWMKSASATQTVSNTNTVVYLPVTVYM